MFQVSRRREQIQSSAGEECQRAGLTSGEVCCAGRLFSLVPGLRVTEAAHFQLLLLLGSSAVLPATSRAWQEGMGPRMGVREKSPALSCGSVNRFLSLSLAPRMNVLDLDRDRVPVFSFFLTFVTRTVPFLETRAGNAAETLGYPEKLTPPPVITKTQHIRAAKPTLKEQKCYRNRKQILCTCEAF